MTIVSKFRLPVAALKYVCLVALCLGLCGGTPRAQETEDPPPKSYTIERASGAITIDGKLDKEAWKKAEAAHLGSLIDGKAGRYDTTFRMLYDEDYLYVAMHCVTEHVFAAGEKQDDPVYNGDCVKLFLLTGNDPHYYYEFDFSPAGVVWDALIVNTGGWDAVNEKDTLTRLTEYNCKGLETKAVVNGGKLNHTLDGAEKAESWDIEIAIPLTQLPGGKHVPPQAGDSWRGNIYRMDRPPDSKVELQGFSPTLTPNFTRVGRFAYLKFK